MSASIEIRNLSRRYGAHVTALDDVCLSVAAGEFVTLLGPSGSGKSTILKLVAGFEQPSDGDILIDGRSVLRLPSHRRDIGMVFQSYALFPHMSVAGNVAFPLKARRRPSAEIAERVDRALRIARLDGYRDRLPHELSGGQQQRVALARAIVFDPKILLMDEPLAALDRHLREQMKSEIKRIQQELHMTVLFVTHDQDEALALSDRVGVMRNGQLEQLDAPDRLYNRPCNRFIAGFVGEANLLPCEIRGDHLWFKDRPLRHLETTSAATSCWVLIRPERIRLAAEADAAASAVAGWPAQVVARSFLGESCRYVVDTGLAQLVVKQQNQDAMPIAIGDRLRVSWAPEDVVILPG